MSMTEANTKAVEAIARYKAALKRKDYQGAEVAKAQLPKSYLTESGITLYLTFARNGRAVYVSVPEERLRAAYAPK